MLFLTCKMKYRYILAKKQVDIKLKKVASTIKSSLWLTMEEKKLSPRLTHELSTIYAWTIDFFKIQEGDSFNIYYRDRYIDGKYWVLEKFWHQNLYIVTKAFMLLF